MSLKKTLFIALGTVLILAIAFLFLRARTDLLIRWQANQKVSELMAGQTISPTRFEVIFCGTGSPQHHPDRGQPCLGVVAAGKFFLFDAGQGTAQRLNDAGAPIPLLETIFLTHLHSDHMSDLGETLHNGWLYGRQHLVDVVGPPGTQTMLQGFQQAYAADVEERQRVVGAEYLDPSSGMGRARDVRIEAEEAATVYDEDGLVIRAFRVDHPDWPFAYGYRIEFQGQAIVVSGDTHYSPNLVTHAKGADMLIHEALNEEMMSIIADVLEEHKSDLTRDRLERIATAHTPTTEVARAAAEAGAAQLVLTHLIPPIPANVLAEQFFTRGMDEHFEGEIIVARDGMRLVLSE